MTVRAGCRRCADDGKQKGKIMEQYRLRSKKYLFDEIVSGRARAKFEYNFWKKVIPDLTIEKVIW